MACSECLICMEEIKEKSKVKCGFCDFSACKNCVRESLLFSVNEPHCPSPDCQHTWSYDFCIKNLTKSFMTGPFRERTKNILFDVEKSKIPATMAEIENIIKSEKMNEQVNALQVVIKDLRKQLEEYEILLRNTKRKQQELKYNVTVKKEFKKKCPKEGCSGFLSSGYKCPLCETKVCSKCNEIISTPSHAGGGGESKTEHVCNPDNVATYQLIKQETKPCPECATAIYKIDGCDQMWCTQCKVPFSWKTGQRVTGRIHNPHFYEWQENNQEQMRNVGEILCGGVIDIQAINTLFQKSNNFKTCYGGNYDMVKYPSKERMDRCLMLPMFNSPKHQCMFFKGLLSMHRNINHFQHIELDNIRRKCNVNDTLKKPRIEYIRGFITEKSFKSRIGRNNTAERKNKMILHIFEMYYVTLLETYNDMVKFIYDMVQNNTFKYTGNNFYLANKDAFGAMETKIMKSFDRMKKLRNYSNKELWKISKLLNLNVPFIESNFRTISIKYNDEDFQLYETSNNKRKKIKNQTQTEYFNNSGWFNSTILYVFWSRRKRKWCKKNMELLFKNEKPIERFKQARESTWADVITVPDIDNGDDDDEEAVEYGGQLVVGNGIRV